MVHTGTYGTIHMVHVKMCSFGPEKLEKKTFIEVKQGKTNPVELFGFSTDK